MTRLRVAAIALVLGVLAFAPAKADDYQLLRLDGKLTKWGEPALGSRVVVTYAVADRRMTFEGARNCKTIQPVGTILATSRIARAAFDAELAAAFAAWQRVANVRFLRVADPDTAGIVIGAQVVPRGRAYTNVFNDTAPSTARISRISRSLICINPLHRWKVGFDGDEKIYDLRYTFIHEIGHAIGLDHPGPEGEIMGFRYKELYREPQAGDIKGAVVLYGQPDDAPLAGRDLASDQNVREPDPSAPRNQVPELSLGTPGPANETPQPPR